MTDVEFNAKLRDLCASAARIQDRLLALEAKQAESHERLMAQIKESISGVTPQSYPKGETRYLAG